VRSRNTAGVRFQFCRRSGPYDADENRILYLRLAHEDVSRQSTFATRRNTRVPNFDGRVSERAVTPGLLMAGLLPPSFTLFRAIPRDLYGVFGNKPL